MAEFCRQCAGDMFPPDRDFHHDFAGLSKPEDTEKGLYPVVLCEGCGPCQVDHTGKCISTDCLEKHGVTTTPEDQDKL